MRCLKVAASSLLLMIMVGPALATLLADCPELARTALAATDQLCDTTRRNEACYGHQLLQAQPQPGVDSFVFDRPGNQVDVAQLQSLRLSAMQLDSGVWGVALMRLQANIPASQRRDVTLLTFGDVQIENKVESPTELDVTVSGHNDVSVLQQPRMDAEAVGLLAPGQTVTAHERLADNSWLRVELPENGEFGWVSAPLVTSADSIEALRVANEATPFYRPMQAFQFSSGAGESGCSETPPNGLLIRTPEGVGEINFLINEVNIRLGSTVFFQAQPGSMMTISTLEGHAAIEAGGELQVATTGMQVSVPLDENLAPAGPPSAPQPFDQSLVETLPLDNLASPSSVVVEGKVEQVEGNVLTVDGMMIELDPADPLLQTVQAGESVRVEGNVSDDGTTIVSATATVVPPTQPPTVQPTNVPPTNPPPTDVPPTQIPVVTPTDVPPTEVPATLAPPTNPPPTNAPPTEVLSVPPTDVPATSVAPALPPPTEPTVENPPADPAPPPTVPLGDDSSGSGYSGMGMGSDG